MLITRACFFFAVVSEDGSPHGPKNFVLWNPPLRQARLAAMHTHVQQCSALLAIRRTPVEKLSRTALPCCDAPLQAAPWTQGRQKHQASQRRRRQEANQEKGAGGLVPATRHAPHDCIC